MEGAKLRLQLLANGFSPLPNVGKACYMPGWPGKPIDEATIREWGRRHKRWADTGLRVENGLCVIDLDINHEDAANAVTDAIEAAFPALLTAPVRFGKGAKLAWFCRTAEPFTRLHTRRWLAPGETVEEHETHCVEIFGGASPRQFGAFGAHTRSASGEVLVTYRWADEISPLTVPLNELPEFDKAVLVRGVDLAEEVLTGLGWSPVLRTVKGESEAVRVFDLTPEMVFECNDDRRRSLTELEVVAGEPGLRCSASWLEGASATNRERCLVGRSARYRSVFIWESAGGIAHFPVACRPISPSELGSMMASLTSPWAHLTGGSHGRA